MSSNKEGLPPGVKMENTYLHYLKGPAYAVPTPVDTKRPEAKKTRHIPTGFEEDDDDLPETSLKVTNTALSNTKIEAPKPEVASTGFSFMKPKPAPAVVEAPRREE